MKARKVKHSAVYGAFRKALEKTPDWRRDPLVPHLPEVGRNVCMGCMTGNPWYMALPHVDGPACSKWAGREAECVA